MPTFFVCVVLLIWYNFIVNDMSLVLVKTKVTLFHIYAICDIALRMLDIGIAIKDAIECVNTNHNLFFEYLIPTLHSFFRADPDFTSVCRCKD